MSDDALLDAWLHSDQPLAAIAALAGEDPADLARRVVELAGKRRCRLRRDLRAYYQRGGMYPEGEA